MLGLAILSGAGAAARQKVNSGLSGGVLLRREARSLTESIANTIKVGQALLFVAAAVPPAEFWNAVDTAATTEDAW